MTSYALIDKITKCSHKTMWLVSKIPKHSHKTMWLVFKNQRCDWFLKFLNIVKKRYD